MLKRKFDSETYKKLGSPDLGNTIYFMKAGKKVYGKVALLSFTRTGVILAIVPFKKLKKTLIIILALLFLSCEKELEYTSSDYPLEGNYKGVLFLRCDSVLLNKLYPTNIWIASSGEELLIRHTQFTGNAYPSGYMFHYGIMQWLDLNDCGDPVTFDFEGSGILENDSLKENGSFLLYTRQRELPYYGEWKTRSIKIKDY